MGEVVWQGRREKVYAECRLESDGRGGGVIGVYEKIFRVIGSLPRSSASEGGQVARSGNW